ncbi:sortase A [Kribbella sp. VKM Ac-2527]|uniref:Sortase A n=1 Tax=Kribbella caucasensis TaxID=2512215 RepID=A0A4R6K9G9_9ACTN|nr:sortase [Kribbella sp. VKM Ac-2527]TDO46313.1 sortase A [Kribbella sp. VKM Ac-2527]
MTAVDTAPPRAITRTAPARVKAKVKAELDLRPQLTADALRLFALGIIGFMVYVLMIGALQFNRAQDVAYDKIRGQLAEATAPLGPGVVAGDPVAVLDIPGLGLRQVIKEGTTGSILRDGPGHRADTPLPGQAGVSVIYGRGLTFGAPFRSVPNLITGTKFEIATGQGQYTYQVIGVRGAGDPLPANLAQGGSRLTLVTAEGSPLPSATVYLDADLVEGQVQPDPAMRISRVPASQQAFGVDLSGVLPLVLWLELLILAIAGVVWFRSRIGRWESYLVGAPIVLAVVWRVFEQIAGLLPNLI